MITVSYTPLDASGGVPRFNRDIHSAFPGSVHYSWWDVAQAMGIDPNSQHLPEWEKAKVLNQWLLRTGRVSERDVVIADSFWADGLHHLPYCISHQHGNWSHTTHDDVLKGIAPEFPIHAAVQQDFRTRYLREGRKLTTVSAFIADQMWLQWGFPSKVINNGIDTNKFYPALSGEKHVRLRPLVIHFTTTANKGFEHIDILKKNLEADIWLLDEAAQNIGIDKYRVLASANLVVHPSAHEGNSYAVLETLASGVPIFGYDVGLLFELKHRGVIDTVSSRKFRSPQHTLEMVDYFLKNYTKTPEDTFFYGSKNRKIALEYSLERFKKEWQDYVSALVQGR